MSTTKIETSAEQRRAQILGMLHNGCEITGKELAWLLLGMNDDMAAMVECLKRLLCPPPKPRWQQTFTDELVKWSARAMIALVVALVVLAAAEGWRP